MPKFKVEWMTNVVKMVITVAKSPFMFPPLYVVLKDGQFMGVQPTKVGEISERLRRRAWIRAKLRRRRARNLNDLWTHGSLDQPNSADLNYQSYI